MADINDKLLDEYGNAKGIAECSFWIMGEIAGHTIFKKENRFVKCR